MNLSMEKTLNPYRFRIQSVDLLRGIAMIIMALDHVRQFMGVTPFPPEDPAQTTVLLFFVRWITHFCAPVFVFLAGTSAFLYARNTRCDLSTLRNFLFTRGLWIIFVEIFIFNLIIQLVPYQFLFLQVLWVIGWSMIMLAGLIYLPHTVLLLICLAMVFGHNLLDYFFDYGEGGWLYFLLHQKHLFNTEPVPVFAYYPLLPWPGIMALGYLFGKLLVRPSPSRNARIWTVGLMCTLLFFSLRTLNYYGDPVPWEIQDRGLIYTLLSFLNTEKYPPSLLFILMTLGPAILIIPWLEKWQGWKVRFIGVFGKVPFFFYLLHFIIIHGIAVIWSQASFGYSQWWWGAPSGYPESYNPDLKLVLMIWPAVILICYPLCRWFASYKKSHKEYWWLSYF
jgi:uncharacterized membrane protein